MTVTFCQASATMRPDRTSFGSPRVKRLFFAAERRDRCRLVRWRSGERGWGKCACGEDAAGAMPRSRAVEAGHVYVSYYGYQLSRDRLCQTGRAGSSWGAVADRGGDGFVVAQTDARLHASCMHNPEDAALCESWIHAEWVPLAVFSVMLDSCTRVLQQSCQGYLRGCSFTRENAESVNRVGYGK